MRTLDDGTVQRTPLAIRIVEWAQYELDRGVREATNKNDGAPSLRYMGGRLEPWCGHFVATGFREIGAPIPGDVVPSPARRNPLGLVEYMERMFKEHGWYQSEPEPGDVYFQLTREGSDKGPGRHCGIVVQVTTTHVITIDGNYSNRVERVGRLRTDRLIAGFGRRPEIERVH